MKILVASRLFADVSGGVERMALGLINEMTARGHAVELLSWDQAGSTTFYSLDPRVTWHRLGMGDARHRAGLKTRLRRQLKIRQIVRECKPDVVIGFQHGVFLAMALACLGLGVPIVAAERNAPDRFDHLKSGKQRSWIYQTFRLADRITVQFDRYIGRYPAYLHRKITSIPNPVQPEADVADAFGQDARWKFVLCVGRLSYQKNQRALVEAFAELVPARPNWCLLLVGAGEDEQRLREQVAAHGLADRVVFVGAVADVRSFYVSSHLFCLSSRWEGFPNALAEAMSHGLPAVGYADCAGVTDLIRHGVTGLLADGNGDVKTLAKSLGQLMDDDELRVRMARAGRTAIAQYGPAQVYDQWQRLFEQLATRQ